DVAIDSTVASEQLPEPRPVVLLQPRLSGSLELEEQLVPSHVPLPQRTRSEWMWHRENDKLVNAIRMGRRREPRHGGSPVVANDVRCVDTVRVKNADRIANRVLQGIRPYSLWRASSNGTAGHWKSPNARGARSKSPVSPWMVERTF